MIIQVRIDIDRIISDLTRWLNDPVTRSVIARKLDDWTGTGAFDLVDGGFIERMLKKMGQSLGKEDQNAP